MTDLRLDTLHDRLAGILAHDMLRQVWPIISEHVSAAMARGVEIGAGAPNPHFVAAQRLLAAAEVVDGDPADAALVEAAMSIAYELHGISVVEAIDRGIFDIDEEMRAMVRRRLTGGGGRS